MADLPPALPSQYQIYNTYVLDPPWQVRYSLVWSGAVAVFTIVSLPAFVRAMRHGRIWQGFKGISPGFAATTKSYQAVSEKEIPPATHKPTSALAGILMTLKHALLWTPPGLELDLGQIIILIIYCLVLVICIVYKAPLMDNPNRAGFMAVAQLPFVFLFATKNNILSLLWQRGYEKLNFLHRWAGRGMFLSATLHGAFWIRNHLQYNVPILGLDKERLGVLTYAALGTIVLTSLKPIRKFAYQIFFYLHIGAVVAFFVLLNYHTPYSIPWIYPPLALYGMDVLLRLLRYRVKIAELTADDGLMTLLRLEDCGGDWVAGQHVRVRALFSSRVFESHPLTIVNAPPSTSCLSTRQILLGAKVCGDWTKSLNRFAREEMPSSQISVMLDGPYGGSSIDCAEYENVILIAGGSGVTFTLSLLDDLVGRIARLGRRNGECTRKIEFAWCVRSFGNISWFAGVLQDIANTAATSSVELHISVYVTCLCDPESVPRISNSLVTMEKPTIERIMKPILDSNDVEKSAPLQAQGGLAVAVSGPESLSMEARNAIASMSMSQRLRFGRVDIHTEMFAI